MYRIPLLLYRGKRILHLSMQVWQLLTGHITQDAQRAFTPVIYSLTEIETETEMDIFSLSETETKTEMFCKTETK